MGSEPLANFPSANIYFRVQVSNGPSPTIAICYTGKMKTNWEDPRTIVHALMINSVSLIEKRTCSDILE